MKRNILVIIFLLGLSVNMLFARHGGEAFGGAFAGSVLGGVAVGAMTPREKTVVVQQPVQPVTVPSSAEADALRRQNEQQQKLIEDQQRLIKDLQERVKKLEK